MSLIIFLCRCRYNISDLVIERMMMRIRIERKTRTVKKIVKRIIITNRIIIRIIITRIRIIMKRAVIRKIIIMKR